MYVYNASDYFARALVPTWHLSLYLYMHSAVDSVGATFVLVGVRRRDPDRRRGPAGVDGDL